MHKTRIINHNTAVNEYTDYIKRPGRMYDALLYFQSAVLIYDLTTPRKSTIQSQTLREYAILDALEDR